MSSDLIAIGQEGRAEDGGILEWRCRPMEVFVVVVVAVRLVEPRVSLWPRTLQPRFSFGSDGRLKRRMEREIWDGRKQPKVEDLENLELD